ncbi:MAG: lactate racemase domain-containing protein [Desulfitobacteriaceae bacterium]
MEFQFGFGKGKPIQSPRLRDIVQPGEKIVIITSDITRPVPSKLILPLNK